MAKARSLVGLDVHAAKIVTAVLDADTGELEVLVMNGDNGGAAAFCAGLPRPVRVAYEAGLTGYPLARELAKRGVECVVVAPSKIPRATGDKVKNDRRDAEHLVRLLLAGKLHPVRVPGPEEEALRDLVRARETLRLDLMRARHRLLKMLMRHGVAFDDGHAWTQRHRAWLKTVVLEWPAAQTTLLDLEGVIDVLVHRREHLVAALLTQSRVKVVRVVVPACQGSGRSRSWRGTRPVSAPADDFCSQKRSGWLQTPEGQGSRPSPAQPGCGTGSTTASGRAAAYASIGQADEGFRPARGWAA